MARRRTILMYSRSRGGKTTQIGELALHQMETTGLKSLVYSIDKGGVGPILPHIELGVVDLVEQGDTEPWLFMHMAALGKVRNKTGNAWVQADLKQYGMVAIESLTGFSDAFMNSLAEKAAQGINFGGSANVSFNVQGDGELLKIGGNNMSHYNIVQTRILDEFWRSQKLPVPYVVWTAGASRDEDTNSSGKVIGPAVCGKALTAELPRHADLTFRLECLPAAQGKAERHILYMGNSVDTAAGGAISLGNTRVPMGGKELPPSIEPASIVQALKLIEEAESTAKENIAKRIGNKAQMKAS